jgi:cholesterol oxidase
MNGQSIRDFDYDYIIVGSGFGGSVAALRLSEKGYRVLVLEKGMWFRDADFPRTNWNLKRWFWLPALRFHGFFRLTIFRHITVMSGVGVGGGSLVYANVLAHPKAGFFESPTWSHLADWEGELRGHYQTVRTMLGATPNPQLQVGDLALREVAGEIGRGESFAATDVAIYFGRPDETVPDPYFGGKGPERTGCNFCGGCMTGCRYGSKNTLDRNYLHLALLKGAVIQAESQVCDVRPRGDGDGADGADGYAVSWRSTKSVLRRSGVATARGVVFAGGVLGTVRLLLDLKESSLSRLSDRLGTGVRTNSESLSGVVTFDRHTNFSEGVAIGSIVQTDEASHLEPVRYASGSGFWRLLMAPMVHGPNALVRLGKVILDWLRHPLANLKVLFVPNFARRAQILLFMRTIEGRLRFSSGRFRMKSSLDEGEPPGTFMPEAKELAERFADRVNGKPMVLLSETLLGIPTTAHILGGATMGRDRDEGVIDSDNRVFGYRNMLVCDGSMISANPGINPSLTIAALTERAMSKIPDRSVERQ